MGLAGIPGARPNLSWKDEINLRLQDGGFHDAERRVDRRLAPGGSEATVRRKASVSNDLLDRSITTSSKAFSSRGYRPFPQ